MAHVYCIKFNGYAQRNGKYCFKTNCKAYHQLKIAKSKFGVCEIGLWNNLSYVCTFTITDRTGQYTNLSTLANCNVYYVNVEHSKHY